MFCLATGRLILLSKKANTAGGDGSRTSILRQPMTHTASSFSVMRSSSSGPSRLKRRGPGEMRSHFSSFLLPSLKRPCPSLRWPKEKNSTASTIRRGMQSCLKTSCSFRGIPLRLRRDLLMKAGGRGNNPAVWMLACFQCKGLAFFPRKERVWRRFLKRLGDLPLKTGWSSWPLRPVRLKG